MRRSTTGGPDSKSVCLAAEKAARATTTAKAFAHRNPTRQPFPTHLLRERAAIEAPTACVCFGWAHPGKTGENLTETLELIPRQRK